MRYDRASEKKIPHLEVYQRRRPHQHRRLVLFAPDALRALVSACRCLEGRLMQGVFWLSGLSDLLPLTILSRSSSEIAVLIS